MKDLLNDIGKKMPFSESQEYLDGLIDRTTEQAVKRHAVSGGKRPWGVMAASAAAVALLLVSIGLSVMNNESQRPAVSLQGQSPIDEFLGSLTDEEVAQLPYIEIEEIPEY
jgi:hypothetical protein